MPKTNGLPETRVKDMYNELFARRNTVIGNAKRKLGRYKADRIRMYERQIKPHNDRRIPIPRVIWETYEQSMYKIKATERELEKFQSEVVDFKTFREVIEAFNLKLIDEILDGYTFAVGFGLGKLYIRKVGRSFANPVIDWPTSRKVSAERGEKILVYYTDEWWVRWFWNKRSATAPNKSAYSFVPSVNNNAKNGARNKLARKMQQDEFAHLKYERVA